MTAITEHPTNVADSAEVTVALPRPRLEMLPPGMLTIAANVRRELGMTPEFLESVKQHGVIVPIVAQITDEGEIHVLYGQRRTLAAVEAGLVQVPVYVSESQADADRIAKQVVENDQRAGLNDADRAEAYQQLALLGISATQIAKRTGAKKTAVEAAIKAHSTDAGAKALNAGLTVEQALVFAEFEDDEQATHDLEAVLEEEPDLFSHIAQQLRDNRVREAALAALVEGLKAEGKTIVDYAGHYEDEENLFVASTDRADGEPATAEDANAALITTDYRGEHSIKLVITGWKELGFTPRYKRYSGGSQAATGPMNDEQKEERRTLISNNKAAASAQVVRREFVKTLLSRKSAPKGWQHFTVHAITHHPETARTYEGKVAAEMIGAVVEESNAWAWNPLKDHVAGTKNRSEFAMIALVCAGYEKQLPKDAWRRPAQVHKDYLNQLVAWGYTASETEKIIIDAN